VVNNKIVKYMRNKITFDIYKMIILNVSLPYLNMSMSFPSLKVKNMKVKKQSLFK